MVTGKEQAALCPPSMLLCAWGLGWALLVWGACTPCTPGVESWASAQLPRSHFSRVPLSSVPSQCKIWNKLSFISDPVLLAQHFWSTYSYGVQGKALNTLESPFSMCALPNTTERLNWTELIAYISSLCWGLWPIFFSPVVFLLLNFRSSLYILENSPLSDVIFANIFSHSVVCLLLLLTLPFTEQKFFILMKFSFSIPCFVDHQDFCFHMLIKGEIV